MIKKLVHIMQLFLPIEQNWSEADQNKSKIYAFIAGQYIIQFMASMKFHKRVIELDIIEKKFIAKVRFFIEPA
ncbi:MAG: hypothetical protein ACTS73_05130 [Arsenophonus sp. NEOnobi-MAG3]